MYSISFVGQPEICSMLSDGKYCSCLAVTASNLVCKLSPSARVTLTVKR